MLRVGYDLMLPVFERLKTFHAFDLAATVIGSVTFCTLNNSLHLVVYIWPQRAVKLALSWCYLFTFFVS
jgi:hypothetical protein